MGLAESLVECCTAFADVLARGIHHSGGGTQALCLGRAAGVSRPYAVSGGVTCTQALPSCELRPEPGPPGRPPHPPAPSYRPRPRPGPRSHWSFRHPRQCLPGLPSCPLVRPGPPRKFEKKKKFYGRMEGAGAALGKGRAGATAAGGREGRRAGCAAEPGPRVPCSVLGRRHDGEWPRLEPSEAGNRVPGQLGPDLPPWFPALLPPRSPCCGGQ